MKVNYLTALPVHNEERHVLEVLREVLKFSPHVLVVDDGSTDRTPLLLQETEHIRVVRHRKNQGYGAALQTGYKYANEQRASLIVQMDADGQHDPRDIPSLIGPIQAGEADLVVGSRFLEKTSYKMGKTRTFGRLLFQRIARMAGLEVTDPTSGFQAMNRRVLELYSGDFFPSDYPDVDVLLAAFRRGLRIRERTVHMRAETRKSTLHGGLKSSYYVYRLALALWAGGRVGTSR